MTAESPLQPAAGLALQLPVTLSAIEDARQALLGYLDPFRPDDRLINRLEVVMEELLSNVVRHGAGATSLTVAANFNDGAVDIAIEDDGPAFNPLEMTEPARFTTLEEARIGGLGIPLVRRLTRSVRYDRVGDRNRISAVVSAG